MTRLWNVFLDSIEALVIILAIVLLIGIGAMHAQTIPGIHHFVIIIPENRSFTHMFGTMPGVDGPKVGKMKNGRTVVLAHSTDPPLANCGHNWANTHSDIDGGLMDGFAAHCPVINGINQAYVQLWQSDMPDLWALAQSGVVLDHMFASVAGPSFSNHWFIIAAQNDGFIDNPTYNWAWGCSARAGTTARHMDAAGVITQQFPCDTAVGAPVQTISDLADAAGVTWRAYTPQEGKDIGFAWVPWDYIYRYRFGPVWTTNMFNIDNFATDVANGQLAQLTYLIPKAKDSGHPLASIHDNELWLMKNVNALKASPEWASTVVMVIYDDFGGYYDGLAPPVEDRYGDGIRVAAFAVGPPITHPGTIDHTPYDFSSTLATVELQWNLGCLTPRDCGATSMLSLFQ